MFITSSAKYCVDDLIDSMNVCVCVCACDGGGGQKKEDKISDHFFQGGIACRSDFLMQY